MMVEMQRFDNVQEKLQEVDLCHFSLLRGYLSRPTESDIRLSPSQSPSMTFMVLKDIGNNRFPSKYGGGGGEGGKIP